MSIFLHRFFAICAIFLVTACIPPRVDNRGHVDIGNRVQEIKVGQSSREEVRELLGSPSLTNHFGEEVWYYVKERKEAVAFLAPEVKDQKVTRIVFDNTGTVSKVEGYGLKDSQQVQIASEITPTEGQELGFFEQVLGNVGRFNAAGDGPAAARGGSRSSGMGTPGGF